MSEPLSPRGVVPNAHVKGDEMMKRFDSGSLIPGATWHAEAESEAEVIRRAVENLRTLHGETEVRPDMIERIKARIVDTGDAPKKATKH
jgi:predicted small metal-binding protein